MSDRAGAPPIPANTSDPGLFNFGLAKRRGVAYVSHMPALPAIITDRLDRFAAALADAPTNASTPHPTQGIAWSYVVRNAVASVLMGVVEATDWELQGVMPERAGVMPISTRLYFDASEKRGTLTRREPAIARGILESFCEAVIASPTREGLAAAQAKFIVDTKGFWA